MSDAFKKLDEKELTQASGGRGGLASLGDTPVWRIKGLSTASLSLKSDPGDNGTEIAQLNNGDVVQAAGGKIRADDGLSGKKPVTYTYVYVPSIKKNGWINSDYLS